MITPPLLLGSKFKVLSLVGLSGSGIIGSFSAVHKSANRLHETMDPARDAIRQGMGHLFLGTSQLGSQADEWLSYLIGKRFEILSFIRKNGSKIGSGQKSMVDQGQDWVKVAREAVKGYFNQWLEMLPYLFYFWNRKRVTIFGTGLNDADIRDEIVAKILEGNGDSVNLLSELLDDTELKKGVDELTKLFDAFSNSFSSLDNGNKQKIEKARDDAFKTFTTTISSAIAEIGQLTESNDEGKLAEKLKKIAGAAKEAGEKFQEDEELKKDEKAKQAQKATTDLMNWMISDFLLPMLTNLCDDSDEGCSSVTVEANEEEEESRDSQKK